MSAQKMREVVRQIQGMNALQQRHLKVPLPTQNIIITHDLNHSLSKWQLPVTDLS